MNPKILVLCFPLLFLLFVNNKRIGDSQSNEKPEVEDAIHLQTLDFKQIGNSILFLNRTDTSYYYVSLASSVTMPALVSFASYVPGNLVVRNSSTTALITFSTNSNANGISYLKGTGYDSLFLMTYQGEIYIDYDPPIDLISCKCFPDEDAEDHDCDSGGEGSSGCEVTDGGETGPIGWHNHCSVDCKPGFFACCNET